VSPARLLVRAPNWIGDAVMSLGALRDIRGNFPAARLEVLARRSVAELYAAVPEVDAVREARGLRETARSLEGAFDACILLPNSFKSALEAWLGRIPERWGYARDARGPLLTRRARVPRSVRGKSEVYYYRAMLEGIGLRTSNPPDTSLRPLPEWSERARALLGDDGARWIGLNPGAAFGTAKRWLPERYAAVGELLARREGARIALVGGPAERPLAERIAADMSTPPRVLCGETTLGELCGVLGRMSLLVTNDSGPMHLAAAQGVPLLAIFGPTDWRETAPQAERLRLVREPVYCAPCKLRECPIDHRCMRGVTVERVAQAAGELLH
jgi:heptosyltransferase-2